MAACCDFFRWNCVAVTGIYGQGRFLTQEPITVPSYCYNTVAILPRSTAVNVLLYRLPVPPSCPRHGVSPSVRGRSLEYFQEKVHSTELTSPCDTSHVSVYILWHQRNSSGGFSWTDCAVGRDQRRGLQVLLWICRESPIILNI